MKKMILIAAMFTGLTVVNKTDAQIRFNVGINIGVPAWGLPASYAGDYYYLPDINVYYNIPQQQFIYFNGASWIGATCLPPVYRDYDLYRANKYVINEAKPYLRDDYWRARYGVRANGYAYNYPVAQRPAMDYRDNRRYYNDDNRNYYNDRRFDDRRRDRDDDQGYNRRFEDRHDNGRHNGWR
jgi:hypothetical protein